MAFREVAMVEVREVLRLWLAGGKKKRIAARVGFDPKTVRRYIDAGQSLGLRPGGEGELSDEKFAEVLAVLQPAFGRPPGDVWQRCLDERSKIETLIGQGLRLSKVKRLLLRR